MAKNSFVFLLLILYSCGINLNVTEVQRFYGQNQRSHVRLELRPDSTYRLEHCSGLMMKYSSNTYKIQGDSLILKGMWDAEWYDNNAIRKNIVITKKGRNLKYDRFTLKRVDEFPPDIGD